MAGGKSIIGMLGATVFGAIFAVVGLVVALYVGKPILDKAKASEKWPSVAGFVVSSEVVTKRGDDDTMYSADVVYDYSVEGRQYKCGTVSFGGDYSSSSSGHAYSVTNKYPAGSDVKVFYDPSEPSTAVLEPGVTWMSYFALGIGLIFFTVGMLICTVPICYLAVGAVAVGSAASGIIGKSGRGDLAQPRSSADTVLPSLAADPRAVAMQDGIDIK